eukprot:gene6281-2681_t
MCGAQAVSFASALDLRCGDFGGYRFDRFDLSAGVLLHGAAVGGASFRGAAMPPDADLRGLNLSACDFGEVLRKREKKKGDVVVRGGKRCTVTHVKGDGDVEMDG